MDEHKQSFEERVRYRIALRRFDAAFEACEHLPGDERRSLLEDIARRILQQFPAASSEEPKVTRVVGIEIKQ